MTGGPDDRNVEKPGQGPWGVPAKQVAAAYLTAVEEHQTGQVLEPA